MQIVGLTCHARRHAIVGAVSKVVSMQTIFLVAGIAPALLAAVAMYAARMRQDELANPLR